MPSLRDYHILISHSWDYSSDYETIKRWLDEAPNFMWTNYSVPLTNPLDVNGKRELKVNFAIEFHCVVALLFFQVCMYHIVNGLIMKLIQL